ncbi:hypothetical protein ACWFMI_23750 [Nocardiopsis terrae]|uniref:hypothetical protein n=1 Tax=Streptomyces sp. NPDC057554 TaxID=3350538 RepID=UPI0036BE8928
MPSAPRTLPTNESIELHGVMDLIRDVMDLVDAGSIKAGQELLAFVGEKPTTATVVCVEPRTDECGQITEFCVVATLPDSRLVSRLVDAGHDGEDYEQAFIPAVGVLYTESGTTCVPLLELLS